ncbi:MAG TPA: hypothetical protein VIU93_05595 [Gallionellaceae bacterium]
MSGLIIYITFVGGYMVSKMRFAVLVAALGFSMSAMAAEKSNEISVAGSISSTTTGTGANKFTQDSVNLVGSFGHYFTPQLVGQFAVGIDGSSYGSNNSSATLILGVGAKYYFMDSHAGDIVPFAGARLDLLAVSQTTPLGTTDGSGSQITGFIGASDFLSETASIDLTFSVSAGSYTVSSVSIDTTSTSLNIGFTQRF